MKKLDFVIAWVDGSDENHRLKRQQFQPENVVKGIGRDSNGNRSVPKYAAEVLTVEHGKLSSDSRNCESFDSSGGRRDFGASVPISGQNNSNLARISNYGS